MNKIDTFENKFSDGSSVTVSFNWDNFNQTKDVASALLVEWPCQPSNEIIPETVIWLHRPLSEIARRINKEFRFSHGNGQIWRYSPDVPAQPIEE